MGKKSKNKQKIIKKKTDSVPPSPAAVSSSSAVATQLYQDALRARAAENRGERREAAKIWLDAYRTELASNPRGKHWCMPYDCFLAQIIMVNEESGYANVKGDMKVLQKFADSDLEPTLVRVKAADTIVVLHQNTPRKDLQLSAECCRQIIALCDSATDDEKSILVGLKGATAGDILLELKDEAKSNLDLVTVGLPGRASYDGKPKWFLAGGDCCDSCGKTREALGLTHMKCCKRCGMVYYCSEECQAKKWKAGHKEACRKAGQIEVGDDMLLSGLVTRPELNNHVARVIGRAVNKASNDNSERWKVALKGEIISVAAKNLSRLRPTA